MIHPTESPAGTQYAASCDGGCSRLTTPPRPTMTEALLDAVNADWTLSTRCYLCPECAVRRAGVEMLRSGRETGLAENLELVLDAGEVVRIAHG